jgi:hypothetical protein
MNYGYSTPGQCVTIMPVVTVDCIQYDRVLWMCECQCNEYPVVTVKAFKLGVVWKLGIVSVSHSMWRECNLNYAISPVTIVDQPFEESVSNSRLTSEQEVPSIFVENSSAHVYHQDTFGHDVVELFRALTCAPQVLAEAAV